MLAFTMLWAYLIVLAVPDHLVGQPAGRDPVVPRAAARRLGRGRARAGRSATSCCPFMLLLSRDSSEQPVARARRDLHPRDAPRRHRSGSSAPAFAHDGFPIHWMDVAIPARPRRGLAVPLRAHLRSRRADAAQRSVSSRRRSRMTPTNPTRQGFGGTRRARRRAHHHDDHLYDQADRPQRGRRARAQRCQRPVSRCGSRGRSSFVVVGVCALIVLGLFKFFESQAAANDPVVSPLAAPAGQLPPEPRLLTDERRC